MNLREQYNRDGYVVVKYGNEDVNLPMLFDCYNILYHQDIEKYKAHLAICAKLPSIQNLFMNDNVQNTLVELGLEVPVPPTHPVMNVMGLPIPGGYNGTEEHQDWPSIQGSLDMITVWIPFMNITKDSYPLEVAPGSHKCGLLDGHTDGSVTKVYYDNSAFIPLECSVGDIVFMSGFLVHRTGLGVGFRIAASMRFDNAAEPTFIERNYPCAQKRTVDREVRWKPTLKQIRRIFNA